MIHVDMPPDGPATFTAWKELRGQRCDIVPATTVSVTWSTLEGPGWEDRHLEIGASMRTDRAPVRDAAAVPSPGRSRPVRLVAIFRRGSLVYLHSDVPSAAGLLGGTYQLESCTLR